MRLSAPKCWELSSTTWETPGRALKMASRMAGTLPPQPLVPRRCQARPARGAKTRRGEAVSINKRVWSLDDVCLPWRLTFPCLFTSAGAFACEHNRFTPTVSILDFFFSRCACVAICPLLVCCPDFSSPLETSQIRGSQTRHIFSFPRPVQTPWIILARWVVRSGI